MLTFEQIKELIDLVSARQLQGLEIERSGFRLKIDGAAGARSVVPAAPPADSAALPSSVAGAVKPSPPASAVPASPAAANAHILHSPIVGTFYRAPAPSVPPFVEVGSRVKKGQVLCIIEAMKLMNEIESDADGVIAEIYPQNAQPVEFGEPLFAIMPA